MPPAADAASGYFFRAAGAAAQLCFGMVVAVGFTGKGGISMKFRVHAVEPASRANGPGIRAVIWFQGCPLHCPGCFNPESHDPGGGREMDTGVLAHDILSGAQGVEGVSFSGGEPFEQPGALLELVSRFQTAGLTVLVFSGRTLADLQGNPPAAEILKHTDVLVAGPYLRERHCGRGLLGSSNQKIHFLTDRYHPRDFTDLPGSEVILHGDGTITMTGIRVLPPKRDGA